MTRRLTTHNLQLILGLTILLLFWVGLQAAYSCATYGSCAYNPEVRVNRCHLDYHTQAKAELCCQSEACHRNTPQQRDLGGPAYHVEQAISHLLIHESRTHTPQFKVGAPFIQTFNTPITVSCNIKTPETPLQALINLQTIVLLN